MQKEAKPFASLSPTLLARKGAAKPAMRPQLQPLGHYIAPGQDHGEQVSDLRNDDLGWNDMGDSDSTVVPFAGGDAGFEAPPLTNGVPEVVRSQDALVGRLEAAGRIEAGRDASQSELIPLAAHRWTRAAKPVQRRSALADGRRAAFTLRVDGERHLKLRLACTVEGRSAQQLITEALDRLLDGLPDLEDLARRVKRRGA
jgi:hypothetical protein